MKKLYRSKDDRIIAGVCGGLAEYFGIDPTIIRIIWLIFAFTGMGVLAYVICWIVIPENPSQKGKPAKKVELEGADAKKAGLILISVGIFFLLWNYGLLWWFNMGKMWPVFLIALGSLIFYESVRG